VRQGTQNGQNTYIKFTKLQDCMLKLKKFWGHFIASALGAGDPGYATVSSHTPFGLQR